MAHAGLGEPFVITKPEEAPLKAAAFRKLIESPVLTRVKVDFGKFDVYDVEPVSIPDVLADRPVVVFGKWRGRPEGTISLSGLTGEKPYADEIRVTRVKPERANAALPYLWARQRIMHLSDYNLLRQNDARIAEVTDLGLHYNLLTAYTSFIAVDSEVRNKDGRTTTVNQPLPLPEGVSDYAVGGVMARSAAAPMAMKQKSAPAEAEMGLVTKSEDKAANQPAAVPPLSVKISRLSVTGGLDKNAVRTTVEQHLNALQACFQNMILRETIEIRITIAANGTAKNVEIVNSATKNEIKQCIIQQVKKWQFPTSAGGKDKEATVRVLIGS
jgi:Ca-activated chloride channel family protein